MNRIKMCFIDILLTVDFVILALSGFLLHGADASRTIWAITHIITAVLCIVLVVLPIIQHAKMMKAVMKSSRNQK